MRFRLVLQPVVSIVFAIRSGRRDAREGRLPYFWSMFRAGPAERSAILRDGWKDQGRVLLVAAGLDVVYQAVVLRAVHPGEALIVAVSAGGSPVPRGSRGRQPRLPAAAGIGRVSERKTAGPKAGRG